ncbi:two-component regulator propeller domain-containing protein [Dokdonia sp. Hel_I_53]|uniref:type IX secretion system anionic LPS delivery protein PorZ n=1 Tax=Dokdonia sp. Hel_I_53 TaxID=1566287 RepID=UPI00119A3191|nr:two-component regulator propeller domain-containing protein [Dokdonia sp. Hel_I_53]TVZ52784.1 putative secreted protein (Por secretion system target) [Dokdonia sp. Hel_I_53]
MRFSYTLLIFLTTLNVVAQDFSQDWTGHFSFTQAIDISSGSSMVYVACENAVYSYDVLSGEVETITTINGLSGNTISSIYYSEDSTTLFIGYENGIIDVVSTDTSQVLTVVDIFNKPSITPDRKRIHHFTEFNGFIYIASGFGISLFDLNRLEFDDSYFIGDAGALLDVRSTAIKDDYIYAATNDGGLRRALVNNDNIINSQNWETVRSGSFEIIVSFNNNLYLQENATLYKSTDGINYVVFDQYQTAITDITTTDGLLHIVLAGTVVIYDATESVVQNFTNIQGYTTRYSTAISLEGYVFVGTLGTGVAQLSLDESQSIERLLPNGPLENNHFDIAATAGNIWTVFGDYDVFYNPFPLKRQGISQFIEGSGWESINPGEFFGATDLSYISINPQDVSQLYVSSYHSGLIEVIDNIPAIIYDENNSSLKPVNSTNDDVRVAGTAFDREGNLWVGNSFSITALHKISASGQFSSFNTEEILAGSSTNIDNIVVGVGGNIFIGTDKRGVIAYNPITNTFERIAGEDGAANLPIDDIRSLAIDRNGALWIGTRLGLRVLFGPSQVFENPQVSTSEIIILQDGLAQELLNDQVVTDIVVDGANNKWLATADSGVFYISPTGQETIFHFTKDNSPLPSNSVQAVAVDPQTGSVYFGTNQGMVSFNGSSTAPADNLEEVLIYPNPVRPNYNGNVRIENLTANTNVKITDLVGNLVYEETTSGGSIEWDTTAFGRHKVASGVYLVLLTGPVEESQETAIEKIMIIR